MERAVTDPLHLKIVMDIDVEPDDHPGSELAFELVAQEGRAMAQRVVQGLEDAGYPVKSVKVERDREEGDAQRETLDQPE